MIKIYYAVALVLAFVTVSSKAQEADGGEKKVTVTGSVQSDILIPQEREIKGETSSEWGRTNTYVDVNVMSQYVDAGARFSYLEHPLPGYEKDFRGWGVPFVYVKLKRETSTSNAELTLGNFYDQFGSGFVFRTYEERSLGIDNSLLGARLVWSPTPGVNLKGITGKQRRYWDYNDAWVSGADMELNIDQWWKAMQEHNTYLMLGASIVNKHESSGEDIFATPTYKLNLPSNVNAFDVRARLQTGDFNVLAEYAHKSQDPNFDNGYIYRKGYVAMLSATYSKRGMSVLLQAKRSDNMSFRSRRSMFGTSSFINHLPAFTMDHTYALAALHPYATHPDGEWAYQAEIGYKIKKNTWLGGKYGTDVKLNFSHVHAIDQRKRGTGAAGSDGYGSAFWKWGDQTYYQDINVQVEKKLSRAFKLNLMYMNQQYNKTIVEGDGGMIRSNIFIAEGKYRFNNKFTLRGEAQYLTSPDEYGDWYFGLLELSVLPNWMFTVSDMYNKDEANGHYYQGFVTFNSGSHRLQLGYGRTRAGFNCSGGVCRYVPETKGVTLSYNYNF